MDERDGDLVPEGPERARRRRGLRLGAIVAGGVAVGAATVLIFAGLTSAGAQTGSPGVGGTPGAGSWPHPPGRYGPGGFRPGFGPGGFGHGGIGFGGDGPGVLHGEFTAVDPNGGYRTIDVQTGEVTSVSSSSITVKSQDGFTRTYGVDTNTLVDAGRDGISNVKAGDTVRVVATVSGGASKAVEVFDISNLQRLGGRWMPPGRMGPPGGVPSSPTGA